jgi:hypothetical protein
VEDLLLRLVPAKGRVAPLPAETVVTRHPDRGCARSEDAAGSADEITIAWNALPIHERQRLMRRPGDRDDE